MGTETTERVATISRTRIYPSRPRPGFAWHYVYDIKCGDYSGTHDRLDSARNYAKRELHATKIVETWRVAS